NQVVWLDFKLEVGQTNESIQVVASSQLLESSTSAIGQVVNNNSIVNLPLNQRIPTRLFFSCRAFRVASVPCSTTPPFRSMAADLELTTFVDGIPSSPPGVNPAQGFTVFPSVDGVQEFKAQTSSYSAEFGRSPRGFINLVFKAGTNQLHGSLFEFLRNS